MTKTLDISQIDKETGEITVRIITPFIRTPYNYNADDVSRETGTECLDETLTQQQFKDECDINTILEKFNVTGMVPTNVRQPLNQDFIEALDYKSALNAIMEAEASFMEMPANVRAEFANDPGRFIDFMSNPKNRERAIALGLVEAPLQGAVPPPVPPNPTPTE